MKPARLNRDGLPVNAEDWRDLHEAFQGAYQKIAAGHRPAAKPEEATHDASDVGG